MRKTTLAAAVLAAAPFLLGASAVVAGELADSCIARLQAEGRDTSGCTCLEDKVKDNQALMDEMKTLGEIADPAERYAAASPEAKAAMDACTRKAQ
jgi:hypothetical protein